ncbi:MAG: MFS transporter [Chloroflexi bacterium]|nr:MFS transporter [Chloroflexota bacterium]
MSAAKRFLSRSSWSLPGIPGLVLLFVVAHFAHHLVTALPIPLLPFIRDEFALDYTRAALVVSAFSVPYGIAQLPAGWLADRVGPRLLLLVGTSGVASAGLLVGVSTSYMMLLLLLALMGLLGGGYHPSAPTVISSVTDPAHRGRALGLHMIGGSASFFIAPLAAAALSTAWGWRSSFVALALPAIAFGFVFYAILGRRARDETARPVARMTGADTNDAVVNRPALIVFLVLSCVTTATVLSAVSFIPLYLVDIYGFEEHNAAAAIALFYSTGLWASVLGGYVSDRLGRVRVVVALALLCGPALLMLSLGRGVVIVMGMLVILGVAMYARAPAAEAHIVTLGSPRNRSTILGFYYFGSMEGSGILAPVVGFLIDRYGFSVAYAAGGVAVLAVAGVCSVLLLRRSRAD